MSDRGTPYSYRHMDGFGSHTFLLFNARQERVWVKFHFKTLQGIKNFSHDEALAKRGTDPDWAQRDLVEAIDRGDYPRWALKLQIMTDAQARSFRWNPFDLTKIWPHGEFPLIVVGIIELNAIPDNYFADVEQAAFAPAHVVDGIGYSPDKMLQGRLLSYPDAHRYRLGVNYEQLPVNCCPFAVANYQRDGCMRIDGNGGSSPNYWPNSFDDIAIDQSYKEPPLSLEATVADWYDCNAPGDDDHYTQPGNLFRNVLNDTERQHLIHNIVASMQGITGPKRDAIIAHQLCHFCRADTSSAWASQPAWAWRSNSSCPRR
jgi:catalase